MLFRPRGWAKVVVFASLDPDRSVIGAHIRQGSKFLPTKHSLTCFVCILQEEGLKGKWIGECSCCSLSSASRSFANPIVCALQASTRFARFGLPLTHFKEKGLFIDSPCEGLTDTRQVLYRIRQLAVFSASLPYYGWRLTVTVAVTVKVPKTN